MSSNPNDDYSDISSKANLFANSELDHPKVVENTEAAC